MAARDFKRLGAAVVRRRATLGRTQEETVRDVELSVKALQRIESGELTKIRAKTLGELDKAVEWEPGSALTVLEGGDPAPSVKSSMETWSARRPAPDLRDDVERQLWKLSDLGEEDRWGLITYYRAQQSTTRQRHVG